MPATATRLSSATYTRPWMAEYQTRAVFNDQRYSVIEASTKSGKTVACIVWLLEQAMQGSNGQQYWWVSPIYLQAEIAFRRMKHGLPAEMFHANESRLTIALPNGTTIWFKGADNPDSLYGEDVYAAVIDEASRCKEEAWHAVRSTLTATRGPIRVIGNVKGRRNWAYHLARRAESGAPDMAYFKITASDAVEAGVLSRDEIEDARAQLPAAVFQELYAAEPSDDGGNPFGLASIRAAVEYLHTNCEPEVWGWDLAKSQDWTVGIALCSHGKTCRLERWQRPWQDTLRAIQNATQRTPALVDSTGVGDPILEALQASGAAYEGFKFTAPSKQMLMEGLAVAIQSRQVGYPEGPIVNELETFEYEYTRTGVRYTAPEGLHDDCVCALALAVHHRAQATTRKQQNAMIGSMMRTGMPLRQSVGMAPKTTNPADWMVRR